MCDDLANTWGTTFCCPLDNTRRIEKGGSVSKFGQAISCSTDGKFVLLKPMACGSDANLWAISDATGFNTSACLFAAGSYIAGDGGSLQPFSSSKFNFLENLADIAEPSDIHNDVARSNTVGLPYHINGVLDAEALEKYEDECLLGLHTFLVLAKMKGNPFEALLLELCLAGNGGVLSDRALKYLGELAFAHGLRIIVDEIMTAGRSGEAMLLLQSKPKAFQDVVTHVTVGKWVSLGAVLVSPKFAIEREARFGSSVRRGASTYLGCEEATSCWITVMANQATIADRRRAVLKRFRVPAADAWGIGLLIFAPVRRTDSKQGLKSRFLPMIHSNTPIDPIKYQKMDAKVLKQSLNHSIVQKSLNWVHHKEEALSIDYLLCSHIARHCKVGDHYSSQQWRQMLKVGESTRTKGESMLRRAADALLMHTALKGKKRCRFWFVDTVMIPPWKRRKAQDPY
jgi:hypothetical protein